MNHSRTCGASVYEKTKVTSVNFAQDDPSRPVSVTYACTPGSLSSSMHNGSTTKPCAEQIVSGTTGFKYMIDASGRAGVMSTRYLKNRHFNSSLKNVAVWAYWGNVGTYGVGTMRQGSPWFEALTGNIF